MKRLLLLLCVLLSGCGQQQVDMYSIACSNGVETQYYDAEGETWEGEVISRNEAVVMIENAVKSELGDGWGCG